MKITLGFILFSGAKPSTILIIADFTEVSIIGFAIKDIPNVTI